MGKITVYDVGGVSVGLSLLTWSLSVSFSEFEKEIVIVIRQRHLMRV